MEKRKWLSVAVLFLMASMVMAPVTGATEQPPGTTVTIDCEGVRWVGTVPEGSVWSLQVRLSEDDWGTILLVPEWSLDVTGSFDVWYEWEVELQPTDWYRVRIVEGDFVLWGVEAQLDCPTGEGCTPGYWKARKHQDDWAATGLAQTDDFDTTFGLDLFDPDITLFEAVKARGGGLNLLARHGTAALLSAAHPDVGYPYSVDQVIAFVQAGNVDPLVEANELGCEIP